MSLPDYVLGSDFFTTLCRSACGVGPQNNSDITFFKICISIQKYVHEIHMTCIQDEHAEPATPHPHSNNDVLISEGVKKP